MGSIFDITAYLRANTSQFTKGMKNAGKQSKAFSKEISLLKGQLLAVFSVGAIVSFTKESMKLSAATEGVKNAFQALNKQSLLGELRKATRGAVGDLSLMKAAVLSENFKIPLDQLATFLQYAGNQALRTGQDFDYLVDSIVRGLGRESVLVLDNLGLSAKELRDEAAKTGSFFTGAANVIQRDMAKAGTVTDTTATKFAQLAVSIENVKTAWGNFVNNSKFIQGEIKEFTHQLTMYADENLTFWQKVFLTQEQYKKILEDIKQLEYNNEESSGGPLDPKTINKATQDLTEYNKALEESVKLLKEWENPFIANDWMTEPRFTPKALLEPEKPTSQGLWSDFFSDYEDIKEEFPEDERFFENLAMRIEDSQDQVKNLTKGLLTQSDAVGILSDSFMGFFTDAKTGWQNMLDTFSQAINRFLAEQAAKAALWFILDMVSGGTAGTFKSFMGVASTAVSPGNVSSQALNLGGQTMTGDVNFKIGGKDLVGKLIERNS